VRRIPQRRLSLGLGLAVVGLLSGPSLAPGAAHSALTQAGADAPPAGEPAPRNAGTDVPTPKRTKFVPPVYPPEAQSQGLRGIVILELVINEAGKVASANVIRSVPPFDEAALSAVRQWEYDETKLDGRPVRVRLTVPITFALRLPEMTRAEGIPELRQGAAPGYPAGAQGPARVVAEVRLLPDGSVAEAGIKSGGSPWAEALLQALRTWRFAWEGEGAISFDVEATFGAGGGAAPRVDLKLSDVRRLEDPSAPAEAPASPAGPAPAAPEASGSASAPAVASPEPSPAPGSPADTGPDTAPAPGPAPDTAMPPPSPAPGATPEPQATPTPPPVEVISGGPVSPPAAPPPPPQPGLSSVRDVSLAIGVPDLAKGRRPVMPPLVRMAGTGGQVEVDFAVDAAGATSVQDLRGPEALKEAARQTVASWGFRRTSAERLYLRAAFTYEGDQARAQVAIRGAE
jgi:TonB family protein